MTKPEDKVGKSSFPNAEKEMPHKSSSSRRGVDPPKNESGRIGAFVSLLQYEFQTDQLRERLVYHHQFFNNEFGIPTVR